MRYPDRRWTSFRGIAVRWAEVAVLAFLFVVGRLALGVDSHLDLELWATLVLLSTLMHTLVWIYARPRPSKDDAAST